MTIALSSSLSLPCGGQLKNRFAKAAMTEGLGDEWNRATQRHETLYRRWAKGGAGLLLTGNVMVDRRYLERAGNVAIDGPQTDEQMQRLSAWAHAATSEGAAIWMQISHAGRQSPKAVAPEPVGPSAVEVALPGGQFAMPRALEAEEIADVIERFGHTALVAKKAGFTGVQIHAAHGYLISEFLNPLVNKREDEWGGPLENRARLLLRTIERVRTQVGGGFPVSVKLNSSDFQKGGFNFDECLQVIDWLNRADIDLLEISGGSYEQPQMMGLVGAEAPVADRRGASTKKREAYFLQYAEEAAKIAKMPLMVTGGFRTKAGMEDALLSGGADVIGLARPLCVEPDLPAQFMDGMRDVAPSWENTLQLGPGYLGPNSSNQLIKTMNGFGVMAFFYKNIFRLADGLAPKEKLALFPAFVGHQMGEANAAKRLMGR